MSYGGNADPTGIQVTFLDQTGAKSVKAVIAFSVPVSRILPNIITKMNLPDDQPRRAADELLARPQGGRAAAAREPDPGRGRGPERRPPDRLPRGRRRPSLSGRTARVLRTPDRLGRPVGSSDHARITPHPTPPQRPGRAGAAPGGKLGAPVPRPRASPAQQYLIEFRGKSLARERGKVVVRDRHEVEIKLGASYPRTMPEIRWLTPIYHPNISEIGMVCLGGYGTHWVPSLNLDELCGMLWDMARYHNYDIRSPYNREAALWVANQTTFLFPIDARPLRDLRAALGRVESDPAGRRPAPSRRPEPSRPRPTSPATRVGRTPSSSASSRPTCRPPVDRRPSPTDDHPRPTAAGLDPAIRGDAVDLVLDRRRGRPSRPQ